MIRTEWVHATGQTIRATYTPATWAKRAAMIKAHGGRVVSAVEIDSQEARE